MNKNIQLLDNSTINKIAAGEVIENPRSIVKELIENSIDANANEIIIEIKDGGKKLIRVTDNGIGIEKNDVELAFKRHSTSKIKDAEDLNYVHTLGFRGEALASIAAISSLEIITKTSDDDSGIRMILEGGKVISKEDIGCPVGTTIIISDLFYNVPARRKFLKSNNRESANINEMVTNLSLCTHKVSFKLINNCNIILKTPKNTTFFNSIASLYGKDLCNSLINVNFIKDEIEIKGYTTNLNYYRGSRKYQIFFVNGRYIKNKQINFAIENAYKTLLPINKHAACFLKIAIPTESVDVNVHPAKTEIRFNNEDIVMKYITESISISLNSNNIIKEVKKETIIPTIKKKPKNKCINNNIFKEPDVVRENSVVSKINNIFDDNLNENNIYHSNKIDYNKSNEPINVQQTIKDVSNKNCNSKIPELNIIGVLFNTYILCESYEHKEFYIIDQHAAHERINYEKFMNQINNKKIVSQEFVIPKIINLSHEDFYVTISNREVFATLGFIIENFGVNSIMIRSIPVIFAEANVNEIFYNLLDIIKNSSNKNEFLINKIVKHACVKSVKAGDKLHQQELKKLLSDLSKTSNPLTCPHGRPVIIKLTKYEIEKMFERIQN